MTDHTRDRDLQEAFDRHRRGKGPPPNTADDPDAAAYQQVFAALGEEPGGDLPADFAEQVAARVELGTVPTITWVEIALLFLLMAGLGTGLVLLPSATGPLWEGLQVTLHAFDRLSDAIRLDVVWATVLVLLVTLAGDALLSRFVLPWRAQTAGRE